MIGNSEIMRTKCCHGCRILKYPEWQTMYCKQCKMNHACLINFNLHPRMRIWVSPVTSWA